MTPSKTTNRYIILDRDGVIIEDKGYVHKIKDLKFVRGAVAGLKKLQRASYKFVIITNQAGIARGFYTATDTEKFNDELLKRLIKSGIKVEKIYYCPHHPKITGPCQCRKPSTKLVEKAAKEFGFEPTECLFVGDKDSDIQLGINCGGKTCLIDNGQYKTTCRSDVRVKNLEELYVHLTISSKLR